MSDPAITDIIAGRERGRPDRGAERDPRVSGLSGDGRRERSAYLPGKHKHSLQKRDTTITTKYFVEPPFFSGSFSPIIGDNKKLSEVRYAVTMDGRTK